MVVKSPELPDRAERLAHLQPLCQQILKEAEDLHLDFPAVVEALERAAKNNENAVNSPAGNDKPAV